MTTTSASADSTATAQTIEGKPAMTTTTTTTSPTAPGTGPDTRPGEATAADSAQGAGIERRETEDDDPAATGSTRAGTAEDSGGRHQLMPPGWGVRNGVPARCPHQYRGSPSQPVAGRARRTAPTHSHPRPGRAGDEETR